DRAAGLLQHEVRTDMSQQGLRQASFRAIHAGDGLTYNGDLMAAARVELTAADADVPASLNGRLLAWAKLRTGSMDGSLPGLLAGVAADEGADRWTSLGSFDPLE